MTGGIIIGIDGGGSGLRAALRRPDWALVQVEGGPANVHLDPDAAALEITRAVGGLLAQADLPETALSEARICAGLAGCRTEALIAAIADRLPFAAHIVEDSTTAAKGALGDDDGVLASLGTGSFFIRQSGGTLRHIGGWGFELGDQASGAWLGREALSRSLMVLDGRRAPDALSTALLAAVDHDPLTFARGARAGEYAALAPIVLAQADSPSGRAVMADLWAEIDACLADLDYRRGTPLVFAGGLGRALAPLAPPHLADGLQPARGTPLDGALLLAEALA